MMNKTSLAALASVAGMLLAGPAPAGGEAPAAPAAPVAPFAPAAAEAPAAARVEDAVRAREAKLAELRQLSAEVAELARAQAARAAERARFEVRMAAADEAETARRAEQEAAREAETEARLREAEMRLEEAAREIAELTAQIVGEVTPMVIEGVNHGLKRAMLGVNVKNVGDDDDKAEGVLVVGVTPGWPADEAGIRTGDILVSVAGAKLDWSGDSSPMTKLMDKLGDAEPGDKVEVVYRRDGDRRTAQVETRSLADSWAWSFDGRDGETVREFRFAPVPPVPGAAPHVERDVRVFRHRIVERWGDMELVGLTAGLGDYFGTTEGVLVVRAPKDDTLGLKDGDVIVEIGGRKPSDPGHVLRILRSYEPGEKLTLSIVRQKKRQSLSVEVPKAELPEAPPAAAPAPTALPAAPAPAAPKAPAPLKT